MIIHLLICPLVQVSVSPFVLSLVGPSVNPRQRLVTRLKKTRPLRGTHRTRKLRVALENACFHGGGGAEGGGGSRGER